MTCYAASSTPSADLPRDPERCEEPAPTTCCYCTCAPRRTRAQRSAVSLRGSSWPFAPFARVQARNEGSGPPSALRRRCVPLCRYAYGLPLCGIPRRQAQWSRVGAWEILVAGHNPQVTGCWIGHDNRMPLEMHLSHALLTLGCILPSPGRCQACHNPTAVRRIRPPCIQPERRYCSKCWLVTVRGGLSAVVRERR